jgi:hypothetical protein
LSQQSKVNLVGNSSTLWKHALFYEYEVEFGPGHRVLVTSLLPASDVQLRGVCVKLGHPIITALHKHNTLLHSFSSTAYREYSVDLDLP